MKCQHVYGDLARGLSCDETAKVVDRESGRCLCGRHGSYCKKTRPMIGPIVEDVICDLFAIGYWLILTSFFCIFWMFLVSIGSAVFFGLDPHEVFILSYLTIHFWKFAGLSAFVALGPTLNTKWK